MELIEKEGIKTFKVKGKRADKTFPIQSPEIGRIVGAKILKTCKVLSVDVHNPDCELYVDVRREGTYIFRDKIKGFGGLPLGTNGKGLILMSGGIDSPVAAFMMAKRGMRIEAVHFHSYPYTSPRAPVSYTHLDVYKRQVYHRFTDIDTFVKEINNLLEKDRNGHDAERYVKESTGEEDSADEN